MSSLPSLRQAPLWSVFFFVSIFLLLLSPLHAQRVAKISLGSGTAYYNGDLTDGFTNNLYRPTVSFGISYYVNPWVSFRGEITQATIGAADSLVNDNVRSIRNLSFRNNITDFSFQIVFDLLQDREMVKSWGRSSHFTPYAFLGVGGFFHTPRARFQGEWYNLHSLGTEGQYLLSSNNGPYSRFQMSIPLGVGLEFRASKHWGFQIEASYRYTFTDYLDDVSTVFPDQELMRDQNQLAAYFANPSGNFDLFPDGSIRGNPELLDSYVFVSLKAVYFFEEISRYSRCFGR